MRMRAGLAASALIGIVCASLVPPAVGAEVVSAPETVRAASSVSGTPEQLLASTPTVPPLRVGYKSGLFPNLASPVKDKRGCALRNQMLIKLAVVKPRVLKGCRLVGGTWYADFGATKITQASKVRLAKLVPDVYVYGQGASGWTQPQRDAYIKVTPPATTRKKSVRSLPTVIASVFEAGPKPTSIIPVSPSGQAFMTKVNTLLINNPEPGQAELDALKAGNPSMFENWTVSTLLNAKAWGISLSPALFANFQVTLQQCSGTGRAATRARPAALSVDVTALDNPCSDSYTVTEFGDDYKVIAVPQIASTVPNEDAAILRGYGTPVGEVVTRSLFGIHAPAHWTSDLATGYDGDIDTDTIPDIPVGYTRLWDTETTWKDLEPTAGNFDWRKLDKQIQVAQALNARVMLVLGQTPSWAGSTPQSMPTDIGAWRTYVREVCRKYGASISAYEVWNEANLPTFWTGTPAQMADLTKAAFEEIRGCNPSALVVAANTTSRATGSFGVFFPAYLQELKTRNWPADAYSVHSYPSASGGADDRITGIGQFRTALALAGAPFTTVFDTEVNYGLAGLGEGKVDLQGTRAMTLLSRTYIDSVRYGFGSTFWFVWTKNPDSKFGIQLTKQASSERQAWSTTYDWLVGSQFQRCAVTSFDVTVCQFSKAGSNFSIIWHGDVATDPVSTPAGYLTGLGSRACDLYGSCTPLDAQGVYPIGSMPLRIDGPPTSAGPSPTSTDSSSPTATPAPAAPKVIDVKCITTRGVPLWTFECTDFGPVRVGSTAVLKVKVTNRSARPHTLQMRAWPSDLNVNGSLTVEPANGLCGRVTGMGSCTLTLRWTPSSPGPLGTVPLIVCEQGSVNQCYQPPAGRQLSGTATGS